MYMLFTGNKAGGGGGIIIVGQLRVPSPNQCTTNTRKRHTIASHRSDLHCQLELDAPQLESCSREGTVRSCATISPATVTNSDSVTIDTLKNSVLLVRRCMLLVSSVR